MEPTPEDEGRGLQVFFSWQSDIKIARATIKNLIERAVRELSRKHGVKFTYTEATSRDDGAVNIPLRVFENIVASDVFVADITSINESSLIREAVKRGDIEKYRRTPNPNVAFELGFAAAILGWERIILMRVKGTDDFEDIPFDFRQHKILDISTDGKPAQRRERHLGSVIERIEKIWRNKPIRVGTFNSKRAAEELANDEDVVRRLLAAIDVDELELALETLPFHLRFGFIQNWELFSRAYSAVGNHLFNQELQSSFDQFHSSWSRLMDYSKHFEPAEEAADYYVFRKNQASSHVDDARVRLSEDQGLFEVCLRQVVQVVKKIFPTIEIKETSLIARKRFGTVGQRQD